MAHDKGPFWTAFIIIGITLTITQILVFISWIHRGYKVCYKAPKIYNDIEMMSTTKDNQSKTEDTNTTTQDRTHSSPSPKSKKSLNKSSDVSLTLRILATLSILSSTIYLVYFTIHSIINIFDPNWTLTKSLRLIYSFPLIVIGRVFLYTYYVNRLYTTFNRTIYEIAPTKYKVLTVFIALTASIALGFFMYVNITGIETDIYNDDISDMLYWISLAILVILDITYNIILLYMFIRRLKMVSKDSSNANGTQKSHVQLKFEYLIRKLTVLVCISVISTFVAGILNILLVNHPEQSSIVVYLDQIVSCLGLLFSFNVYDKEYRKYCCCFI
mmetsp:Transcript_104643/g.127804  ORF Transcript_104643/g.127804 Transcript_104643/m.127804 type:complete len:329 (-) Transcript_104643:32-1018(-)